MHYNELTDEQQSSVMDCFFNEKSDACSTHYVICDGEALPLSMFERMESKVWHGVYATSAFSAYFIRMERDNQGALVADRHF
jgi:hypothetical protein